MDLVNRFLRYVRIDTQSAEEAGVTPSTPGQMEFVKMLRAELEEMGLEEITLDEYGYLFATLPANTSRTLPTIGFIAHVDTSPDVSGKDVKPRVVESYNEALMLLERGEFNADTVAPLKGKLRTVFNRDFWGGYYAHKRIVEHTNAYGSSATHRKEYVGKITNYFKNIGVAEITVEASTLAEGDDILIMGETTGVVEQRAEGLTLHEKVVESIPKGVYCSIKVPELLRRGDKLYKMVPAAEATH